MDNDINLSLEEYARQLLEGIKWSCHCCGGDVDKTNYYVAPGGGPLFCISCGSTVPFKVAHIQSRHVIFPSNKDMNEGKE